MSARNVISLLAALLAIAGLSALPTAALADEGATDDPCAAVVDDTGNDWVDDGSDTSNVDEAASDDQTDDPSADDSAGDDGPSADDGTDDAGDDWADDPCWDGLTDDDILGDVPVANFRSAAKNGSLIAALTQTITMPGPGTIDASLTGGTAARSASRGVLGSQHLAVTQPGAVNVVIKLTPQGRRKLRAAHRPLRLSLNTTVTLANGRTISRATPVTVQPRAKKRPLHPSKPKRNKNKRH